MDTPQVHLVAGSTGAGKTTCAADQTSQTIVPPVFKPQPQHNMPTQLEIAAFLAQEFPHAKYRIEAVGDRSATVRHAVGATELRPGGTVAGPVLMAVADVALYVALLGEIGIVPLAVTTNLSINFMRKPSGSADILAVCRLMKLGRTLAVGEVTLYSEGDPEPVAHVVGTYAIPRGRAV